MPLESLKTLQAESAYGVVRPRSHDIRKGNAGRVELYGFESAQSRELEDREHFGMMRYKIEKGTDALLEMRSIQWPKKEDGQPAKRKLKKVSA